jgi:hypothetical protein
MNYRDLGLCPAQSTSWIRDWWYRRGEAMPALGTLIAPEGQTRPSRTRDRQNQIRIGNPEGQTCAWTRHSSLMHLDRRLIMAGLYSLRTSNHFLHWEGVMRYPAVLIGKGAGDFEMSQNCR